MKWDINVRYKHFKQNILLDMNYKMAKWMQYLKMKEKLKHNWLILKVVPYIIHNKTNKNRVSGRFWRRVTRCVGAKVDDVFRWWPSRQSNTFYRYKTHCIRHISYFQCVSHVTERVFHIYLCNNFLYYRYVDLRNISPQFRVYYLTNIFDISKV